MHRPYNHPLDFEVEEDIYKYQSAWAPAFKCPLTHAAHRGCPAVVALLSTLHADLGVAVGRVEPASLLPLLSLLQELEGQSRGLAVLLEHKCCDCSRDLHVALVPRFLSYDGVSVGVTCPVALRQKPISVCFLPS